MTELSSVEYLSLEEFLSLPQQDGWTYELIDHIKMMSPRPSKLHQSISGNLYYLSRLALQATTCKPLLEADLVIGEDNLVPDLMILCNQPLTGHRQETPPLIAMEIVSPSSISTDYFTKRLKYEQLGVKEYWIISPEEQCVMVICYTTNQQQRFCQGQVSSFLLPELQFDIAELFA